MKRFLMLTAALAIGACATDPEAMEKDPEKLTNEAIEDFIEVSELEPQDKIRHSGRLQHDVITDDYIFLKDGRNTWLVAFAYTCHDIEGTYVRPDIRHDTRILRSRFDTVRGCRIRDIYPVSEGMVDEIESLAKPYEED